MKESQIWTALLSVAVVAAECAAPSPCSGGEWDVIVVGSGPAGIVVSGRMSEAGKKTLLLEQGGPSYYVTGGREQPDWLKDTTLSRVDVPGLYKSIFSTPGSLLCSANSVQAFQGCTAGGNTAINAGLFFQPTASDWNQYFPDGWKNDDMQSSISKVRKTQPSTDSPSQDGKMYLQSGYQAAEEWLVHGAGYAKVGLNDGPEKHSKSKVFGHPIWNYEGGERSGPVKTYLQAALQRPNFSFRTGTEVVRVIRDGETATGVEIKDASTSQTSNICVKKGGRIILSGGALLSPRLLMWSGIGDPEILTKLTSAGHLKVPSPEWINNTAVGDKLFDSANTFIELKSDSISSFDYSYSNPTPEARDLYLKSRSGPYTFASQTSVFWDSIQQGGDIVGCQGTIDSSGFKGYSENGTVTLNVYGTSGLRSVGRVEVDDNGAAVPSITFFSNKLDASAVATFIHNIFQALPSTLNPLNIARDSTIEQLTAWISTPSGYTMARLSHWSSSCRFGSCVDVDTKVIGMNNLFVVDSSIVPPLTTNPMMGVMITAERAVERILALKS